MPPPAPLAYSIRLRTRFRGLETRDGLLLRGDAGWGEFSPFWDYDDPTSAPWLRAAHEAADLGWPAPRRERVPVNVTIPAVPAADVARLVEASGGCTTAKVKVAERGEDVAAEQARLEAVRDALGPAGRIRVDANGAWDLETAASRLRLLDRAAGGLEYAEQPCADVADLARLRRLVDVPIAADESIRRAEDPYEVARLEAADVVVLKVQPLGGVRAALEIAERIGLPVVVSSALETSVGIAAGVALAAALPELPYACGLATVNLFTADVTGDPLVPTGGHLPVRAVEPDALVAGPAPLAAPPDLEARWLDRLDRVSALGGAPATTRVPRRHA